MLSRHWVRAWTGVGCGVMQGTEAGSMQDAGRCIGYTMASESCSRADWKWGLV